MLAKSLARSLDVPFSRIQFTPDLLPSDVTGVNVFNQRVNEFEFRPGPVFANVLLVDEINRASPKTQAALLEAMQENQVTIDGESYPLHRPFIVLATQNPIEYEGTYPLPEAQLDRFSMRLSLGYPPLADEARMLNEQTTEPPLESLTPVAGLEEILAAIDEARSLFVEDSLNRYVVALLRHTRSSSRLALGASPRAGIALLRVAKARALSDGRDFVLPDDVKAVAASRALAPADPRARGALGGPDGGGDRRRGRGADARPGLMTRRGRLTLVLGVLTYAVAWLFGAKALYPVAAGLVLAPLAARTWVRAAAAPIELRRRTGGGLLGRVGRRGTLLEGEDVWVTLEARPTSRVPPPAIVITEQIARLGVRETSLRRDGAIHRGTYVLERVPRGRYAVEEARATIDDPFGLARAEVELTAGGALLVYPRLVALDRLFSESGAHAQDGRRLLLRRPSGFDLHSVREYEQGESLRKVHWRTTARRGQLMVKELEDAPRDEIAVLLDADATAVSGESFDVQVRAAGSILRAHAAHGRRAVLAVNSASRPSARVSSLDGEWLAALGLLAEAQPDGTRPVVELLARESGPASRALETVVVTARLSGALATKLVQRALAGQGVSVVWIDTASFAGRPTKVEPELLRVQAAGVAVAVAAARRLPGRRSRRRARRQERRMR